MGISGFFCRRGRNRRSQTGFALAWRRKEGDFGGLDNWLGSAGSKSSTSTVGSCNSGGAPKERVPATLGVHQRSGVPATLGVHQRSRRRHRAEKNVARKKARELNTQGSATRKRSAAKLESRQNTMFEKSLTTREMNKKTIQIRARRGRRRAEKRSSKGVFLESPVLLCPLKVVICF